MSIFKLNLHFSGALNTLALALMFAIFVCMCVPLKQPGGECVPHSEAVKRRLTRVQAECKHN